MDAQGWVNMTKRNIKTNQNTLLLSGFVFRMRLPVMCRAWGCREGKLLESCDMDRT